MSSVGSKMGFHPRHGGRPGADGQSRVRGQNPVIDSTGTTRESVEVEDPGATNLARARSLIETTPGVMNHFDSHHEFERVDEDAMHRGTEDPFRCWRARRNAGDRCPKQAECEIWLREVSRQRPKAADVATLIALVAELASRLAEDAEEGGEVGVTSSERVFAMWSDSSLGHGLSTPECETSPRRWSFFLFSSGSGV